MNIDSLNAEREHFGALVSNGTASFKEARLDQGFEISLHGQQDVPIFYIPVRKERIQSQPLIKHANESRSH